MLAYEEVAHHYPCPPLVSPHRPTHLDSLVVDRTSVKDGSITVGSSVEPGARLQLFVRDRCGHGTALQSFARDATVSISMDVVHFPAFPVFPVFPVCLSVCLFPQSNVSVGRHSIQLTACVRNFWPMPIFCCSSCCYPRFCFVFFQRGCWERIQRSPPGVQTP